MAIRFVSSSLIQSSSFYARESGSESGSLVSTAYITVVGKDLGEIKGDFNDDRLRITLTSQSFGGSGDVNVLTMSASADIPRVGIGTSIPRTALDIEEIEDSATGTRLLLKSARTNLGAQVGDSAGNIIFAIDSSSFNDIFSTGSIAEISTIVKGVQTGDNTDNMSGNLVFKSSPTNIETLNKIVEIGFDDRPDIITPGEDPSGVLILSGALIINHADNSSQGDLRSLEIRGRKSTSTSDKDLQLTLEAGELILQSGSLTLGSGSLSLGDIYSGGSGEIQFINYRGQDLRLGQISGGVGALSLDIYTGGTKRARFDNTGNLGIGTSTTTSPEKLTVEGNISASGDLTANNGFFSGNLEVTGAIDVKNGHINLDTNSYFLQGTSTGGGNVSLIGVDGTDFVSIGNQGFTNIIYDSLITGSVDITGSLTVDGTITGNSIIGTIGTATQGTIDHDSLANFVANEHINHTSVSILSGDGLSGGGTIASTRTLTLDTSSAHFTTGVSESAAAAGFGGGGGGSGTVTEVTVGTGLDVTNGTTTPNVTLDLTEITLSNGLDSTATGLTLDLSEVGFTGTANGIITSDNDGTVTTESTLTYNGTILTLDGTMRFTPGTANNGISTRIDNQWESTTLENNGEYVEVGTAISRTQHFLYNLGSSGWVAADADAVSTSAGFLGVAVDGTTASTFLIRGVFNILSTNITDPGVGKAVYVSTTAGAYTCTAPVAAGDVVRIVGHVVDSFVSGRSTYYKIYFNPSQDWIEL